MFFVSSARLAHSSSMVNSVEHKSSFFVRLDIVSWVGFLEPLDLIISELLSDLEPIEVSGSALQLTDWFQSTTLSGAHVCTPALGLTLES